MMRRNPQKTAGMSDGMEPESCVLYWLALHEFDKNNVQISKSELFGSHLPVYVA